MMNNQPYNDFTSPTPPTPAPRKPIYRRKGCMIPLGIVVLLFVVFVVTAIASTPNSPQASTTPTQTSQATHVAAATQKPAQPNYPPKTQADLKALAALGDASAVHEFHSESVGMVGACPQPKREVTVDQNITGQKLAEDLLAYFYANQLDSPCGSIVFAYHTQDEANGDGYTAGRIQFDAANPDGSANFDPNSTNLKYTLTLDMGDVPTGQEYTVNY